MSKWHKGPPPSVGWWPASFQRKRGVYRWWNGKRWSWGANSKMTAKEAEQYATELESFLIHEIEWQDRPKCWPARSRT